MNLTKNGKVFTSKFVGTGLSSYEKEKNLPGRVLTNVEKHWRTGTKFASTSRWKPTIRPLPSLWSPLDVNMAVGSARVLYKPSGHSCEDSTKRQINQIF